MGWNPRPLRPSSPVATDWRPREALSRRSVLRGLARGALVSVALPPLQAMFNTSGTAYACDGVLPVRFGLWFWGNGNLPQRWTPDGTGQGDEWALSEQLMPLAALKHKLCVVSGMACKVPNTAPHSSGAAGILSASALEATGDDSTFARPSIDQVIADGIGGSSIFKSVQTAATDCTGQSYNGPNSRNAAETDPYAFYARLFGDTFVEPGGGGIVDPRLGLRRSVLDTVMGDIAALDSRLGSADKIRLEQHLDGVRELEQRLALLQENPPDLEACVRPASPVEDYADVEARPRVAARNAIMSDLLAMALACDQTRVFAHFLTDPVSDVLFEGAAGGHHDLTHNEGGEQPQVNDITVSIIEQLGVTLAALDAIEEGDGTLLDHCAVFATSEVSLGQTHSIEEMPMVIAGSACGYYQQDVHHRSFSADNATKVLVGLQRSVGMSVSSFGSEDAEATTSLTDIEA